MTFEEINLFDLLPEKARAMVTARGRPSGTATTNTVTPIIINFISDHVTVENLFRWMRVPEVFNKRNEDLDLDNEFEIKTSTIE